MKDLLIGVERIEPMTPVCHMREVPFEPTALGNFVGSFEVIEIELMK